MKKKPQTELSEKTSAMREEMAALEGNLQRLEDAHREQSRHLEEERSEIDRLERENSALEADVVELNRIRASLESDGGSKAERIAELTRQKADGESQLRRVEEERAALRSTVQQLESDRAKATQEAETMRSTIATQETEKNQVYFSFFFAFLPSSDAEYFFCDYFFMYSHSYSFADRSTPNRLLKSIYSQNRHINYRYVTVIDTTTKRRVLGIILARTIFRKQHYNDVFSKLYAKTKWLQLDLHSNGILHHRV